MYDLGVCFVSVCLCVWAQACICTLQSAGNEPRIRSAHLNSIKDRRGHGRSLAMEVISKEEDTQRQK